jgi:dihydrodipicolinate synthase/N-acetylneuraminate lyase
MKLSGVIVPHVTPLTRDEQLDAAGLERLLEFLLRAGIHGIFSNGSMGGFAFYPDAMQLETIARTVEIVRGRVPVLAGVSDTSTTRVLARVRDTASLGADALVVLPPFYYLCRQDEIERFFRTIADASPLPIVIYDNPKLAKNALTPETIAALATHPNIIGVKVSAADVFKWQTIFRLDLPRDRFGLICGVEPMMGLGLQLGFDGLTGGVHNLVPDLAVALFDAAKAGRAADVEIIQQKLNRVYRVFEIDGGWRGAELALSTLGICSKVTAAPHDLPIPPEKRQAILDVLTREGVLSAVRAEGV